MSGWREPVLRLMKVPPEPSPPPGAPPRVFRAAKNFFTLKVIAWIIGNLIMATVVIWLAILLLYVMPADTPPSARLTVGIVFGLASAILLIRLTLGYAVMRLDYELRWYMISDRAIRIREGILTVREKTIALANIQNTAVNQGPLQRLLGIADIEVTTAGGGGSQVQQKGKGAQIGEAMHVGHFRGVDNAQEIRNLILERVRLHRDAGLGDADEHHDPAEDVLNEVKLLRRALENFRF